MPGHPNEAHDDDETDALVGGAEAQRPDSERSQRLNRRTVRKLDSILLPFLAILFLLNSLDKSNIGNAETAGFTYDTGLSRHDVNKSMALFFFVFVLLQPVGAALGRRFGMKRYVPVCMSLWGLSTILHIFVRKRWHLMVLRVAIATLESGFYPTTVSYLSLYYTKYEFAFRLGFFYGMTAVAGALGGVLSWAVFSNFPGRHDDDPPISTPPRQAVESSGWKSWEILFLIEGCLTMTIALIGFFWLPHSAESAWFLTKEERWWAEERMRLDTKNNKGADEDAFRGHSVHGGDDVERPSTADTGDDHGGSEAHDRLLAGGEVHGSVRKTIEAKPGTSATEDSGLTRNDILSAFSNYKIWHLLIVNILSAIPATAFGVLLPILVKELSPSLNLSPAASNLLSAPPFAFGAIVLFIFTIWSDRSRRRLVPIMFGLLLLLIGLTMAIMSPINNYWLRYFSLCVLLSGSFIASPLTVAWLANNTPEPGKRAILLGINGWGNLAGVFMALLFTPEDEKTGYVRSFVILLICSLISLAGFVAFRTFLIRENRFRDNVIRSWSEEEKEREDIYGDVPAPDTLAGRIGKRLGLIAFARTLGLEEARHGDEKMTFRYTL
ncbi:hypothetical protein M409DRAFT_69548 [Zasmidium cellare ATCC 36951]|uniref:Major facilitator superfamily (MFS) profile domain-containing protein n=1 Tax=Zasmidium cellare ATCC 36951 TaxID=1080233 RepID=A0A6A6C6A7_ZASCE|nr:uncharacterized protein M409DRAFT_69548 [Zasmidium cellare ATCC 36951]KAF2161740.1 hypothetical protein M409DRAFT_69548 [Zasmidium cellare ATCC 36951]